MSRRKRQRIATQYARALLKEERAYYREIRRMYRAWLNRTIERFARVLNSQIRIDADDIEDLNIDPLLSAAEAQAAANLAQNIAFSQATENVLAEAVGEFAAQQAIQAETTLQAAAGISNAEQLQPVIRESLADLQQSVQRFSIRMNKAAEDVAKISNTVWTAEKPVDLLVKPLQNDVFLQAELKDFSVKNSRLITKLGEDTLDQIGDAAIDALKRSGGRDALAQRIREIDKTIGENRAKTIARNELGKLQSNLTEVRAKRAGVKKYEWQTVGDNRVRPKHQALDGDIRTFGEGLEPGQDINCRCVAIPIIDEE